MIGGQWFDYSYDEEKYYRLSAAFLAVPLLMTAFAGGYFSGRFHWWWTALFVVWIFYTLFTWLGAYPVKVKTYDNWLRFGVGLAVSLFFLLIWLLGFWMSAFGLWWVAFIFVAVFFPLNKIITKPHK